MGAYEIRAPSATRDRLAVTPTAVNLGQFPFARNGNCPRFHVFQRNSRHSAPIAAADRAEAHPHGAGPPGRRLPWQDAITECWRALSLVYAGLAADRDSTAGSVGELLAGLRAARVDADRGARVRWRLGATEDRLRRTGIVADGVAARHVAAAITRLVEDEGLSDSERDGVLAAAANATVRGAVHEP